MFPMGDLIPLLLLADLGIMVAALFDCITTESLLVRNLPKLAWIGVILILSGIGGVLWFIAGRPTPAEPIRMSRIPAIRPGVGYEHMSHPTRSIFRDRRRGCWPRTTTRTSCAACPTRHAGQMRSGCDGEADLRLREERLRQREDPPGDQV